MKKFGLGYLFVALGLIGAMVVIGLISDAANDWTIIDILDGLNVFLLVVLVVGSLVYWIVIGVLWSKNNKDTPIITEQAEVLAKRTTTREYYDDKGNYTDSVTTCYILFESQDGNRMELCIPKKEYVLLVKGDQGELVYQIYKNSRRKYHGFTRT